MPLTKISTDGVKDDAITKAKIPANQIEASELADNAVDTNAIADQAVTLNKLPHGDSNNDGKFLRANNGADPSFETISQPDLSNLNASNLTSGTVPDARFPAILPAVSGANLTNIPVGINISYAQLHDVKGSTTQGGSFTSGAWRTRDLNTEHEDTDNIVTLSNNQFTLGAGNYHISAHACAVGVNNHAIRLYSITNNAIVLMGFSHKNQEENVSEYARVEGRLLLGDNMVFEIQHRCSTTVTTHGFGAYGGFGDNIYTTVQIYKRNY